VLCYIPYWPEGRLYDLIMHMHLTLLILCVKCLMSCHDVIWYESVAHKKVCFAIVCLRLEEDCIETMIWMRLLGYS